MDCISDSRIKTKLYDMKREIEHVKFPPNYLSDLTFYSRDNDLKLNVGFNCYAYAMQFKIAFPSIGGFWYQPGFLSGSVPTYYNKDSLLNGFINDCKFLGLSCEETDIYYNLDENSYKIAILIEHDISIYFPDLDFHFIRQNDDLSWSEKKRWCGNINLLTNPNKEHYELVKVMKISRR